MVFKTSMKNGRLHVLKIKYVSPSKTPRSDQKRFYWARDPCCTASSPGARPPCGASAEGAAYHRDRPSLTPTRMYSHACTPTSNSTPGNSTPAIPTRDPPPDCPLTRSCALYTSTVPFHTLIENFRAYEPPGEACAEGGVVWVVIWVVVEGLGFRV